MSNTSEPVDPGSAEDTAVDPFVVVKVAGVPQKFYDLTAYDRAAILRKAKAERRAERLANAKAAELDKDQVYAELETLDDETWGEREFVTTLNTPEGKAHAWELSLAPDLGDEAKKIARQVRLNQDAELELLCRIANLNPKAAEPAEGEGTANPQQTGEPDTYDPQVPPADTANPTT